MICTLRNRHEREVKWSWKQKKRTSSWVKRWWYKKVHLLSLSFLAGVHNHGHDGCILSLSASSLSRCSVSVNETSTRTSLLARSFAALQTVVLQDQDRRRSVWHRVSHALSRFQLITCRPAGSNLEYALDVCPGIADSLSALLFNLWTVSTDSVTLGEKHKTRENVTPKSCVIW